MIQVNEIKAEIIRQYGSVKKFAEEANIPVKRVYNGLHRKHLSEAEMIRFQELLKFPEPWSIFLGNDFPDNEKGE